MKLITMALALFVSYNAHATVDAWTDVSLVTANPQVEDRYEVRNFPFVGCFGPAWGPKLSAFVSEFNAPMGMGCGGPTVYQNVNAMSCAKIIESREREDGSALQYLKININACPNRSANFIAAIKVAVYRNFGLIARYTPLAPADVIEMGE